MAKLQKLIVTLLVLSVIFSILSVVFSVVIFRTDSFSSGSDERRLSSNSGNIGLVIEGNNQNLGGENG